MPLDPLILGVAQTGIAGGVAAWALMELRSVRIHKQEMEIAEADYLRRQTEALESYTHAARRGSHDHPMIVEVVNRDP